MRSLFLVSVFAMPFLFSPQALAQDSGNMTLLAVSGDWVTMSHSDSAVDAPDVCVSGDENAGVALRADDTGDIELRVSNSAWSLPADVVGKLKFSVNNNSYSFDITGNSSDYVAASITSDQLLKIVADMETADTMRMTAGSAPPETVALDGSAKALTAFLTCAGISAPSDNTGGNNPFASGPSSSQ